MEKIIVTITGIRPDFIRMANIFKLLDKHFKHILVHTGQHYDKLLSDVFFDELDIRKPDYILNTGQSTSNHYEQLSYLSTAIIELFNKENIKPDLIIFLGDSNSVCAALPLKKEGYKIGHIEAGMRSYDKRMLEEINRTICDHCSDILFVYHDDYKKQLALENIHDNVYVVGNTIVEICNQFIPMISTNPKKNNMILMDIHRPENFKYKDRLEFIINFGNVCSKKYNLPVKLLYFKRLKDSLDKFSINLGAIEMVDLMPYKKYLQTVYDCKFIISDSGTGQEEPALLNTPVIVPRDYTERPQSYENNCSHQLCMTIDSQEKSLQWVDKIISGELRIDHGWLGDGMTAIKIINGLVKYIIT